MTFTAFHDRRHYHHPRLNYTNQLSSVSFLRNEHQTHVQRATGRLERSSPCITTYTIVPLTWWIFIVESLTVILPGQGLLFILDLAPNRMMKSSIRRIDRLRLKSIVPLGHTGDHRVPPLRFSRCRTRGRTCTIGHRLTASANEKIHLTAILVLLRSAIAEILGSCALMSPVSSDAELSLVAFGFRKAVFDLVPDGIPQPPWFW